MQCSSSDRIAAMPAPSRVVAHDLRDAFGTLSVHAERLAKIATSSEASREEVKVRAHVVSTAIRGCVRRLEQVASLLDEAPGEEMGRCGPLDLAALAHEAVEFHAAVAEASRLTVSAHAEGPVHVVADRTRLWQALSNL